MRATTLILAILGTAAASHKYPQGGPSFPGCSKIIELVDDAHQQSQATAFCSSYLPSWSAPTLTKTTTKTIRTGTTITRTTSVDATSLVTTCVVPTTTPPAKRDAHSTPKPQAWSNYPPGPFISSACSCLRPARSTTTNTITKTSITSIVTSVSTVVTATTTINAVQTFQIYGIRPGTNPNVYFVVMDSSESSEPASYVTELHPAVESDGSEYMLYPNGSLVILDTGSAFSTSTPGAPSPAGSLAFQYTSGEFPSDEIIMFAGGDSGISYPAGATSVACTIATNSDGTCPLTCAVNGNTAPDEGSNGAIAIGPEELAGLEGIEVILYAIGSAPATGADRLS